MAESTIVKNKRDFTIKFEDGTPVTPEEYTVSFEAGDLNITIGGISIDEYLDRGRRTSPPSIRYVDDQESSISFSAYLRDTSDTAAETLVDLINWFGGASGGGDYIDSNWVSTLGTGAEHVNTATVTITIEGTDLGDAADSTMVFNFCNATGTIADGSPAAVSMTIRSFDTTPTVT